MVCLVWEWHYPVTSRLLSAQFKGHSHVFVGHVVVVVKDGWDALLIFRQLHTRLTDSVQLKTLDLFIILLTSKEFNSIGTF